MEVSMRKRSRTEQWYVKHIIKSPLLFYSFLFLGIVLFLAMSLGIKMEGGESLLWQIFVNVGKEV